jgi:8-oxo-dGTP pyrophosphatase MutT (NUDIX family)
MTFKPHVTVATLVERKNSGQSEFLMVHETDKHSLKDVINQPAGHVDANETLIDAAIRETLEETAWQVSIDHLIGIYVLDAANGVTYYRFCFAATAIEFTDQALDPDITKATWMSLEQIKQAQSQHRSPLIQQCLDDYLAGQKIPLSAIKEFKVT